MSRLPRHILICYVGTAHINVLLGTTGGHVMTVHAGYLPGCIGRVIEMHGSYYATRVGFGYGFEAKVARELSEFVLRYDPERDGLWLATHEGEVHGSIVIDGIRASSEGAHLRWFITSDSQRGMGTGKDLLGAALEFCRRKSYRRVYLWTFDQLPAARHLYEKSGFELEIEQKDTTWGKEVNEQKFVLRDA
jgi:GNAT superfamily N-acetyltransferase